MIQLVQWDTDNFGFKVGNLVPDADITKEWLNAELLEARNQGYELLYLKGGSIPEELMSENRECCKHKESRTDRRTSCTCLRKRKIFALQHRQETASVGIRNPLPTVDGTFAQRNYCDRCARFLPVGLLRRNADI